MSETKKHTSDQYEPENFGSSKVGDHISRGGVQCQVTSAALNALDVDSGDRIQWRVNDGRLIGNVVKDGGHDE